MKCRLPNFMLSLRKQSQDISESTCKWIPLPPLTKEWTDDDVYKHFKLLEEDIKLINDTNIIGYKNNIVKHPNIIIEETKLKEKIKIKKDYEIIKHKRKNYYLIEDKVYTINKNKSLGELFGNYIDM